MVSGVGIELTALGFRIQSIVHWETAAPAITIIARVHLYSNYLTHPLELKHFNMCIFSQKSEKSLTYNVGRCSSVVRGRD